MHKSLEAKEYLVKANDHLTGYVTCRIKVNRTTGTVTVCPVHNSDSLGSNSREADSGLSYRQ